MGAMRNHVTSIISALPRRLLAPLAASGSLLRALPGTLLEEGTERCIPAPPLATDIDSVAVYVYGP